jgi:WD40 repeat protein
LEIVIVMRVWSATVFALHRLSRPALAAVLMLLAATGVSSGEGAPPARTDLYGDPLPPGAVARLGTIRLRHVGGNAVAFSKDGKRLISCDIGCEVRVWDVATGRLVRRTRLAWRAREPKGFRQDPWHFSLAPDGATVEAWDSKTTYLYDTATGQERGRIPNAQGLAFSPDGKKIAMQGQDKEGKKGPLQLWDIVELRKYLHVDVPPRTVLRTAAFTPDGKQLAALGGEGEELFVWAAATGELRQRKKFRAAMTSLAYAPDSATLAAGLDGGGEVALFDASTLKEKAALPARTNGKGARCVRISQVGFSSDGRLLAGNCHFGGASLQEQGLQIWDLGGRKGPRWLPTPSFVTAFAFAPDGETLACCNIYLSHGGNNAIYLWDVTSGRRLHQPPGHNTPVTLLAVSPDGKSLASGDYKPTLRLWDTATGEPLRSLAGWDEHGFACLLFSADGQRLISVSRQGKLQVWEVATGKQLSRFAIDSPSAGVYPGYTVALFDGGKRLAAVTMRISVQLSIWDAATGEQLHRRPLGAVQPTPSSGQVELAPDAESITVWRGEDRLTIEEISTGYLLATLPEGVGHPLGFSADGRLLAVFLQPRIDHYGLWKGAERVPEQYDVKGLSVIETASGQEVVRLDVRRFDHVAFTPDGRAVVVADRQKLSTWDAATGERLHQMEWPESVRDERGDAKISSLAMLPGGRAATGMTEGDILIWDLSLAKWPTPRPARDLDRTQLDALWSDLAGDARRAYRALAKLAAAPARTVPFLEDRLAPAVEDKRVEKLLADLDADSFETREAASRALVRLRYRTDRALQRALNANPSLERQRRLEAILAEPKRPPAEALRTLRAIAVLERIGTPEARRVLEKLGGGAAARETREAQAALQRLKRR